MKRRYVEESTRVIRLADAHEKRHGCKDTECEIGRAYTRAFSSLYDAEAPLRQLVEGLRVAVFGVPCTFGCGRVVIRATWRTPSDACYDCWKLRSQPQPSPEACS